MPPSIRITASNSSRHTPKTIAKHQHFKSTGLHLIKSQLLEKKKANGKKTSTNSKPEYNITGYTDLELYPGTTFTLEDDGDDEIIEDDEEIDQEQIQDEDPSPVMRGIQFLINHRFNSNIPPVSKGVIKKSFKDKIIERRDFYPPVIIKNQLYALFVNQITKVDREIDRLSRKGEVMTLLINHIQFNDNLVVRRKDYLKILGDKINTIDGGDSSDLINFQKLILDNDGISVVTEGDLSNYNIRKASVLINHGFLNFSSQDQTDFYISLPNLGNYLNFLKQSNSFIIYLIQRLKGKQILEKDLTEKWELNYHNWYKFYGVELKFILSLSYGMGYIENFNTNVGDGWKIR